MEECAERPKVPADIKRRVLVEAGHRCAIPTCRYIEVEIHHIVPWAKCQAHEYENLIALCPNCHNRADRNEIDRKALRLYKFNLRAAHDKFSQIEMDMLLMLANAGPSAQYPWMPYLGIFFTRCIEAGYLKIVRHANIQSFSGGIDTTPSFISITDSGRMFVTELGLNKGET